MRDTKESKDDKSVYSLEKLNIEKSPQSSGVDGSTDVSTLWEDLLSLRHFRLKHVEVQCYLLTHPTVIQHPLQVHGIQWENLKFEILRFSTYNNYPKSANKSSLLLARDGFVYIGNGSDDKVMCYSCCATKNNWLPSEDVSEVHRSMSAACRMVTGVECSNVSFASNSNSNSNFDDILKCLSDIDIPSDSDQRAREATHLNHATNHGGLSTELNQRTGENHDNNSDTTSDQSCVPSGVRQTPNEISCETKERLAASSQTTSSDKSCSGQTISKHAIPREPPKYPEYASIVKRLETFATWPIYNLINSVTLAQAGLFYSGYSDCVRCFQCGLGLRSWKEGDEPLIEHAKRSSRCSFLRQLAGHNFTTTVHELKVHNKKITSEMFVASSGHAASNHLLDKGNRLKRDPAVRAMIENGFTEESVLEMAHILRSEGIPLSSDVILIKLQEVDNITLGAGRQDATRPTATTSSDDSERIRQLKEENGLIRQKTTCRICLDKNVEVLFLPCGHLVSCADCASTLNHCSLCRTGVKGTVRAFFS